MENEKKQTKINRAVIDIGTNSTRMLIFRLDKKGQFFRVNKSVRYTRMGQDVDQTHFLHPDAMKRNLEALEEFMGIAEDYDVVEYYIFGTSAMRDAENTQEFIDMVKERLGLSIEVVSGDQEAAFGFMGVSLTFQESILIFDIGGGSTEIMYGKDDKLIDMNSLNLGCVRSTEQFIAHDPPLKSEVEHLSRASTEMLKRIAPKINGYKPFQLIGIGGTATTISTIKQGLKIYDSEAVHNSRITQNELKDIISELVALTLEERSQIVGLEAKRADVIIAGALILDTILTVTGEDEFTVCDYDNLEGAAYSVFLK